MRASAESGKEGELCKYIIVYYMYAFVYIGGIRRGRRKARENREWERAENYMYIG